MIPTEAPPWVWALSSAARALALLLSMWWLWRLRASSREARWRRGWGFILCAHAVLLLRRTVYLVGALAWGKLQAVWIDQLVLGSLVPMITALGIWQLYRLFVREHERRPFLPRRRAKG